MAGAFAITGRCSSTAWIELNRFKTRIANTKRNNRNRRLVCAVSPSSSMTDPYKTLKIRPDASESEIKTAFRRLALQYHPDVCRGSNCMVQFHQINEAYHIAMDNIREETKTKAVDASCEAYDDEEQLRGMDDPDWDMWEEWMGWEGAGIRDYSSHINPYI